MASVGIKNFLNELLRFSITNWSSWPFRNLLTSFFMSLLILRLPVIIPLPILKLVIYINIIYNHLPPHSPLFTISLYFFSVTVVVSFPSFTFYVPVYISQWLQILLDSRNFASQETQQFCSLPTEDIRFMYIDMYVCICVHIYAHTHTHLNTSALATVFQGNGHPKYYHEVSPTVFALLLEGHL